MIWENFFQWKRNVLVDFHFFSSISCYKYIFNEAVQKKTPELCVLKEKKNMTNSAVMK